MLQISSFYVTISLMEKSKNIGLAPFVETVLEYSSVFEYLGHSRAFEQVLLDNQLERQDDLVIDSVSVPYQLVPAEIIESHNWPSAFDVKDLKASLISCPRTSNCEEAWSFTASYVVNGQEYHMRANEDSVISNFYDNQGGSHEHTFDSGTGMRFMKTVALGLLYEQGHELSVDRAPLITPENPEELRTLFRMMGNMKGEYNYKLSAYVKDETDVDRGLMISHIETESPSESGINIDFTMIWKIGNGGSTKVSSHQQEVIDSAESGQYWSVRYAERGPTESEPGDLPFIINDFNKNADSRLVFLPIGDNLGYETANTSIMTILVPYLRPYLHLDQNTPSEIFEAKKTEEFTD